MATINITDQLQLNGELQISDKSSLALANLKNVSLAKMPIVGDFSKPIDQFTLDQVEVGLEMNTPSILVGDDAKFTIGAGTNATLSVYNPKRKTLFGDDDFAPVLEIKQGECWAGLCITVLLQESIGVTSATGFGVSLKTGTAAALGTFVHFPFPGSVIPTFKEGLSTLLENYSVPSTPAQMRAVPTGVAHTADISGSVSLGASYSVPLTVNPMATLNLPVNLSLKIAPAVVESVKGAITLDGSFVVRTYKSAETKLVIGLYKKHQTTLTASLTTSTGIEVDAGKTDLLAAVLNAVVPHANVDDLNLDESQKQDLTAGLKQCVDQSISIAMNACCTASDRDEAAVIYELDLTKGDMDKTDLAMGAALSGDWSQFEALSNATPVRHILRDVTEHNHKLNINLLGFYNSANITDYLKSTTVVQDENGQISIVDKVAAKRLSAGTTPYTAKAEKLRSALAEEFVATVTYGACAGKLSVSSFTVHQAMLDYHAQAGPNDIKSELAIAKTFGFTLNPEMDSVMKSGTKFVHNKFYIDVTYDLASVYRLFFQDVINYTPYAPDVFDRIGRSAKIDLLDPMATNSMQRRAALSNDTTWNAMNEKGDANVFKFIPTLAKLDPTALGAISADWTDIRWWSDAMRRLAPKLSVLLKTVAEAQGANPLSDAAFMAAHKNLESALLEVSKNTHSAFADGWPLVVMYRLASSPVGPSVQMDISINGKSESQTAGPIAKSQSTGV